MAETIDLLKKVYSLMQVGNTETKKVNWLDLTDSQKASVLEQARAYLREQIEIARIYKSLKKVLDKNGRM